MSIEQLVEIWLIDDDDGHALLVQESFEDAGLRNPFSRACDGRQGWEWLLETRNGTRKRPGLILLDVSMPNMDGFELLERIKSAEDFRKIPVIMLTSTDAPKEIERCYRLGVNAYIVKPVDFEHMAEKIRKLGLFLQIIEVTTES